MGTLKSNKIRDPGLKESGRCAQRHRSQRELWRVSEGLRDQAELQQLGVEKREAILNEVGVRISDVKIYSFLDCRYYRLLPQIWKRKPTREHHLTELLNILRESFSLHLELLLHVLSALAISRVLRIPNLLAVLVL